jgi:formimidoylglutamate deiminase
VSVLHAARALTAEGWKSDVRVTIDDGAIAAVEIGVVALEGDERHAIMAPAAADLHSHAFQRAMAGLAEVRGKEADTFWTWRETMYRFALMMSPEDVEAVAAQLYVEMLEAGFAAVAEFHYLHHAPDGSPYAQPAEMAGRILSAAGRAGIGITLLPVFYAHSTFGGAPPKPEQRRFICDLASFARLLDDCRGMITEAAGQTIGVAPHSLRAVTAAELLELMPLAGDGPIHIHAAEQIKEVEDCIAALGARPVRWLIDHAGVGERWCLVHATHLDEGETRDLARSGAVAGLCPVTEANLGDGIFNAADYIGAGGRYGVGTDSNVSIGVAGELRQLEYAQRLRERARNVCTPPKSSCGRTMLEATWLGGAQALRRNSGKLAPGAAADILTFRADHPTLAGKADDQVLDTWIFSVGNPLIDCVWSSGLKVVSDGRHVFKEEIAAQFAKTMRNLSERPAP